MHLSVGAVMWLWLQPILPTPAADAPPPAFALYWQPPNAPDAMTRVKDVFAEAVVARKGPRPASDFAKSVQGGEPFDLRSHLLEAEDKYRSFKYVDAMSVCTNVARVMEAQGGGDLDARAIADVYLYRGLSRFEVGQVNEAWEDIVRSTRIDATRLIDPAMIPPRAAAMYRRAIVEVVGSPHAELVIRAPAEAEISIDGRVAAGPMTIALGPHLLRIDAHGFEPWMGVIAVNAAHQTFEPPLRAWQPPDNDRLLLWSSRAKVRQGRVVLGAIYRTHAGWRFLARVVELPGGQTISEEATLGPDSTIQHTVSTVLSHVLDPAVLRPRRDPPAVVSDPPAWYKRWWIWALAGGAATGLAIALTAASTSGSSGPALQGSVGGPAPPTRP